MDLPGIQERGPAGHIPERAPAARGGNHPDDEKWLNSVEGMTVYTASELEKYLLNAGFGSVESFKKENDYILVVIAKK